VIVLVATQLAALASQVAAVCLARQDHSSVAEALSDFGLALAFGGALWVLTRPQLTRSVRNAAVVCLGVVPTLMWRATNPLLFTGFDEQLHMRTLGDIISSHRLFEANPLLEVSPRYPGLEAVTVLVHQLGVPTMASAVIVVLVARVVLVTVLCDAVEQLTGNARAGGIAVAVYAVSPQFVFFNSQFAYQTMALPLALAAVSLIARSRSAADPLPFFGGATICLLAVAVTHHVTSFVTAAFLLAWIVIEKGQARVRVAFGACAAIASTLTWAIVQRSLLTDYFGPIIDDVSAQFRGGARRSTFQDSAGTTTPLLDQVLLLYYAAALSLVVLSLAVLAIRFTRRGARDLLWWVPHLLLLTLTGLIPLLLAARVVPKGGELFDRSSSLLFIPFSVVFATYAVRLWWQEPGLAQRRAVRLTAGVLAAGVFLGGYVLGSGPNWARLPGSYLVAADTRSMDAENLAAVKWARDALPSGSRIGAERVSSILLAAQAGLWPVMKGPGDVDAPALYVAPHWSQRETDIASAMQLRYLYVDRRWANELPHFGNYFFKGETGEGHQLTDAQLTKFDAVPGIRLVYRHGPISIYDLKDLGVPTLRSGWYGTTPDVALATQLAVGMLCGLCVACVMRLRVWRLITASATRLRLAWGAVLTTPTLLASACLASIVMLLLHVWLTPLTVLSAVLVVLFANLPSMSAVLRRGANLVTWHRVRVAAVVGIPLAVIVAVAVLDAATVDIVEVRQILNDPNAIHSTE
jgi:hypothetical protein